MRKGVLLLVIVLVLIIAGWFLFAGGSDDVVVGDGSEGVELNDALPVESVIQEAKLGAVGSYTGSGSARSVYLPGNYVHTVTTDLGDPADGKFYEGWLVGGPGFISTGKMDKGVDGYTLGFTSEEDLTRYTGVVITEETEADGLDGKPEAHVLEGDLVEDF